MARLKSITIENYRSIGKDPVTINFPERAMVSLKINFVFLEKILKIHLKKFYKI